MKRIIAMILVMIMTLHLTACGQNGSIDLMQDVPAKVLEVQPDMDTGAAAIPISVPAKPGNVCLLWHRWPGSVWFTRKVRSQ